LGKLSPHIHDWQIIESIPTYVDRTSFRICHDERSGVLFVEKRKAFGWRLDRTFNGSEISELVKQIEDRAADN
jgi:hypothetical protein